MYALVIVSSQPWQAPELFKYKQIISTAASEFQGTAFLAYDEQFLRQAANDLRISWDQVDIELCTVTFSGLAKPHCLVCSSPHHSQSSCPSANRFCQSSKNSPVCFRFNRSSGCNSHSCLFQHVCCCVPAVSPKLAVAPTDPPTRAIAARDKVSFQDDDADGLRIATNFIYTPLDCVIIRHTENGQCAISNLFLGLGGYMLRTYQWWFKSHGDFPKL